ncbi:hypothetical protein GCM10010994_09560 [Chelatococcus reniformis]|uniref:Uncharacterized protein n=1 Tax=Chelatococcus reniformis TaxID=1494448 RepID=A0A916TZF6_9HYPH|nr:hypothetical protein GCM10010994_09560 [Chelatococcus reniformis]
MRRELLCPGAPRVSKVFAAALVLWGLTGGAAYAQLSSNCPSGLKFAAGACVQSCPAGYEDRGRVCVYRSLGS